MGRQLILFTFVFLIKVLTAFETGNLQNDLLEFIREQAKIRRDVQRRGLYDNLPDMSNFTNYMAVVHNRFRAKIAKDYKIPNMNKLVYDAGIARKAQAWAESCQYTNNSQNAVDGYSENRAFKIARHGSMVELLRKIFDEASFNTESHTCAAHDKYPYCENYLNAIWPTSVYIGCGRTTCPYLRQGVKLYAYNTEYVVCYYSPRYNYSSKSLFPVSGSAPCESCSNTCVDGALCLPPNNAASITILNTINSVITRLNCIFKHFFNAVVCS